VINRIHIPHHIIKSLKSKKKLSRPVKEKFYRCLEMLVEDFKYPSLRSKTVKGTTDIWEFSINKNYRCLYRKEKDDIFILAISRKQH
jgi:mRNA-degrading endonuclease RelE of RelBE toxin-antitoxin system